MFLFFFMYWCLNPHWHGGQLHIYLYIDIYMIHNMTYIFLEIRFRHRLETCLCQPFLWNIDLPEDDTGSSFRSQGDAILTQFEAYLDTHQALDEDIHFLLFFENHLKHNGCHSCGGGRRVVLRWWLCRAWQLLDHVAGGICAPWHIITASPWYKKLGGGCIFKDIFTPIWGRFPFWLLFSNGVGWNHQPTRKRRENLTALRISTLNSMGVNHHEVRAYLGGPKKRCVLLTCLHRPFFVWVGVSDLRMRRGGTCLEGYICIFVYICVYIYILSFFFPGMTFASQDL